MKHRLVYVSMCVKLALLLAVAGVARAEQVVIDASLDNTLYESATGSSSNGAGPAIYAGRTGPNAGGVIRRGLIMFDVGSQIPSGATINSVSLAMRCTKSPSGFPGTHPFRLHRVIGTWGEAGSTGGGTGGPAQTGDATWQHRFFNSAFWTNDGGDFSATVSAETNVTSVANYTWASTSQLVADVQFWLDNPNDNGGWILRSDETTMHTAREFASRQNSNATNRPKLTVDYTPAPDPPDVMFSTTQYEINESSGSATISVTLSAPPGEGNSCTVNYATSNGSALSGQDYTATSGTLTFTDDETVETFTVSIIDDGAIENDETILLSLSSPSDCVLGSPTSATLTIFSNDLASNTVYVDFNNFGPESGSVADPYNTMTEALAALNTGGQLFIFPGVSDFADTLDRAMTLNMQGDEGSVRLGAFAFKKSTQDAGGGAFDMTSLVSAAQAALAGGAVGGEPGGTDASGTVRAGGIRANAIPSANGDGVLVLRDLGGAVALRLHADEAIAPESISASAVDGTLVSWQAAQPGAANDLWVIFAPETGWADGTAASLGAQASTVSGTPIEVVRTVAMDTGAEEDAVPPVADGLDAPAAIGPEAVYETPRRVWLPIPAGIDPAAAGLYYYHPEGAAAGWYPAAQVAGWLVPDSYRYLEAEGVVHLGFLINHAAIVQLGIVE